jgi:hypothetical protein
VTGQAFEEGSISRTWVFEWKSKTHQDQKKVRQVRSKVKSILNMFFDIIGIVHKEFFLAGKTVTFHILLQCFKATS